MLQNRVKLISSWAGSSFNSMLFLNRCLTFRNHKLILRMPQSLPSCRFGYTKLCLQQVTTCSCSMPYTRWYTEGFLPVTFPNFKTPDKFWSTSHFTSLWYIQASAVTLHASGHFYEPQKTLWVKVCKMKILCLGM